MTRFAKVAFSKPQNSPALKYPRLSLLFMTRPLMACPLPSNTPVYDTQESSDETPKGRVRAESEKSRSSRSVMFASKLLVSEMFNSLMSCLALATSKRTPHTPTTSPMAMKKPRARLWCVVMAAFLQIWKNSQSPCKNTHTKKKKEKEKEKNIFQIQNEKETQ